MLDIFGKDEHFAFPNGAQIAPAGYLFKIGNRIPLLFDRYDGVGILYENLLEAVTG